MSAKSVLLEPQHLLDPTLEHTLIVVKPDGYARSLTGEILRRIEAKGYTIKGLKLMVATRELLAEHYAEHKGKPFYDGLVSYITSGPVVKMVISGENAVANMRRLMGPTDCAKAEPGTIRGDFGLSVDANVIHGSDSPASAEREIGIFFGA